MSEDTLRANLRAQFENRAMIYHLIFDELRKEVGEEKAAEIMGRAIRRRGAQTTGLDGYAPADLSGLCEAFVGASPDGGSLFEPEVLRCDAEALDLKFRRCPLKEAWQQAGLPEEDVAKLCAIAAQVDYGTFEAAGFEFFADTYKPGGEGCCFLHVRPGKGATP
jgi:hypothetical protein